MGIITAINELQALSKTINELADLFVSEAKDYTQIKRVITLHFDLERSMMDLYTKTLSEVKYLPIIEIVETILKIEKEHHLLEEILRRCRECSNH